MPDGNAGPPGTPPAGTGTPDRMEVAMRAVLGGVIGERSTTEAALLAELEALGRTVARVKQEIARLEVGAITESHIPTATDELDAIVGHTARATNEILDSCEALEGVAARLAGAEAETLQAAITRIYEACSFQDITGQRIGKVVAALKAIEARVAAVTGSFAAGHAAPEPQAPLSEGQRLAAGPQLPGAGVSQADIDRLLGEF